jgi:hypothetical protein
MSRRTEQHPAWRDAIHIVSLWALAVAGPLYDVLRRSAEFFVAYRAGRRDVLLFVTVVSIAAPMALWGVVWLAGRLSQALAGAVRTALVGLFIAILAAQALQSLSPPTALHLGMSAGFGLLGAALYGFPAVRSFVSWLSPAIVVLPLVFLLDRAIWPMVWPAHERAAVATAPRSATPIVFVVFDQFPLTSLLSVDGSIDARTYPGFGELARTSTWFRNATTVGELTTWALPPILSGKYAEPGQLPTVADYPFNIFTALGPSYKMAVFEPLTGLCPDAICPPSAAVRDAPRLWPMLVDSSVVLAHRIVPRGLGAGLPPVDENWRGFAEAQTFQRQWGRQRESDRRRIIDSFLEAITSANQDATLYFLHALLPHEPYEYLPSGQKSGWHRRTAGLTFGRWTKQEWPVAETYARHLLQVGFVDQSVQRLIQRLRSEGLFDKALMVVTSDHGVSFVPGAGMKGLNRTTAASILPVPLFVKRPQQHEGEVIDRNVQSVDVLPLVADILDVDLPFAMDGRSPLDASAAPLPTKTVVYGGGRSKMTFEANELDEGKAEIIARRVRWFGNGPGPYWTPIIAPAAALRGRSLDHLRVERDRTLRITLDVADDVSKLDPANTMIPALLTGRVRGSVGRSQRLVLAIAVNGRIEATTETFHDLGDQPDGSFHALVNPEVYRPGFNDVRIYLVRGTGSEMRLVEGFRNEAP